MSETRPEIQDKTQELITKASLMHELLSFEGASYDFIDVERAFVSRTAATQEAVRKGLVGKTIFITGQVRTTATREHTIMDQQVETPLEVTVVGVNFLRGLSRQFREPYVESETPIASHVSFWLKDVDWDFIEQAAPAPTE